MRDSRERTRILIADDYEPNRALLRDFLKRRDFEVEEARDGEEAVSVAERFEPHVVLMDLQMPAMDGYASARGIRALLDCRIIAVSANVFAEEKEEAFSAGMEGFIEKPFRLATVLGEIERVLGTSPNREP